LSSNARRSGVSREGGKGEGAFFHLSILCLIARERQSSAGERGGWQGALYKERHCRAGPQVRDPAIR